MNNHEHTTELPLSTSKSNPHSSFYEILSTPYGGRGAFSQNFVPKNTTILTCAGPYASVIIRKFRKEVCAFCFAYAHEHGKIKWPVKALLSAPIHKGRKSIVGKPGSNQETGLWFCSEECLDRWVEINQLSPGERAHCVLEILSVFERVAIAIGKSKKDIDMLGGLGQMPEALRSRLAFLDSKLEDKSSSAHFEVTQEYIDETWALVDGCTEQVSKGKHGVTTVGSIWQEPLGEFELDTARFVLDGLLRKTIEGFESRSGPPSLPCVEGSYIVDHTENSIHKTQGRWSDFLQLQNNELPYTRSNPYMLPASIRAYLFLKHVISSLLSSQHRRILAPSRQEHPSLSKEDKKVTTVLRSLQAALDTSTDTRAILGRDPGNVFGLWEIGTPTKDAYALEDGILKRGENELLGWAAYVFGSYFNHNCRPNLKKRSANGRGVEFYTLKDISAGEELCISYIDEGQDVENRNKQLRDWFFQCACERCSAELAQKFR
ncbi:hypothetical protein CPB83DRAFT_821022 [Crepidotus variabilis]|uniref:SET domain-containing protein n=1 Tax=Crepidotus variabilis TaxID=179855 RepID=A0A9P6E799_9AGAR|nr:hypothetical protein CPB83DRAFT_821022 [Crepidotus variabilis]